MLRGARSAWETDNLKNMADVMMSGKMKPGAPVDRRSLCVLFCADFCAQFVFVFALLFTRRADVAIRLLLWVIFFGCGQNN